MSKAEDRLRRKIERLEQALSSAEGLLEKKSRELYDLNTGLEALIKDRTQQLEVARDKAISAGKAKDRFVAHMSHEIRTPLNGIIGLLDLFKKTSLNQQQRSYLGIIEQSSEVLLSIINDILEYSKIQAGKVTREEVPCDVEDLIEMVANILFPQAHRKKLGLLVNVDKNLPSSIVSDPAKIKQILLNIVGNAIKYTPNGEIEISAQACGNGEISVAVRDTGVGIDMQRAAKIFDPFIQVDASDTRKYGGTGLGLSICKTFSELLGGRITVESDEGVGTTFRVFLEAKQAGAPKVSPTHPEVTVVACLANAGLEYVLKNQLQPTKARLQTHYDLPHMLETLASKRDSALRVLVDESVLTPSLVAAVKDCGAYVLCAPEKIGAWESTFELGHLISKPLCRRKIVDMLRGQAAKKAVPMGKKTMVQKNDNGFGTILLAEDNLINQKVVQHILGKAGFSLKIVENGQKAVEAAQEQYHPVILMDYNMPIMDGIRACIKIREHEEATKAPRSVIIAMTASALRETREECFSNGMDDFVTKPIKADELVDKLMRIQARLKNAG